MDHYQFQFEKISAEQQDILTALLSGIGFQGFEETDRGLNAYMPVDQFNQQEFDNAMQMVTVTYVRNIIPHTNWNAIWESEFEPVTVPDNAGHANWLRIRAGFHAPDPLFSLELEITPRMSFGTGHHATTRLMAKEMSAVDFTGKSVLDFGTGTAVLAILAEKLGAAQILAIDHDTCCISNATDNLLANSCNRISLLQTDHLRGIQATFDIILANINRNIILDNMPEFKRLLKKDGILLLSGLLQEDETILYESLAQVGLHGCQTQNESNWIQITARN